MCMKYAELEKSLGEIDQAQEIYNFSSQYADPRSDADFWTKWHDFEVQHGNEDTFREMLRMKHSVSASYNQTHFILPEYLMQKDRKLNLEETVDTLKRARVPKDEMAALEYQFAPESNNTASKDGSRKLGFVSAGVESQTEVIRTPDGGRKVTNNVEDIDLPEGSVGEDDDKIEIAHKDVPAAVFGDLVNKVEENNKDGDEETDSKLGALERIKRQRQENFLLLWIYVGGLDPSVSLEDLRQAFSHYRETTSVRIPGGKGFGFVKFANRSNAEEALLKLHTTDVDTLGAVDSQKKI
ncbi:hypothetical protein IFM89_031344 [Coptis chinensis]|uniref:RRM domain-containing protein n=1 Tax=Coptis chinensis TaxID=261450 RepID=A0A835J0W3_9MAGN|nr:hypothetical protein IFM89_031344 [Coptis chinensis]